MFDEKSLSNWDAILFLLRHQVYKPGAFCVKLRRWQRSNVGVLDYPLRRRAKHACSHAHYPEPTSRTTHKLVSSSLFFFFLSSPSMCRVRHRPPHQYTHTTRCVVSKVFPTDFASRKVPTVETVWNEAYFGTLNAHSQAQESRCCKCERARWLLRRPRQRTKKRALLRRTAKAHCVLTS